MFPNVKKLNMTHIKIKNATNEYAQKRSVFGNADTVIKLNIIHIDTNRFQKSMKKQYM